MEVDFGPGISVGLDSSALMVVVPIERSFCPDFFNLRIFCDVVIEILYDSSCM